jgi:hypothetical protein
MRASVQTRCRRSLKTNGSGEEASQLAQPLVVAGPARQVREHAAQVLAGVAQPAAFADVAQVRLHHRQQHELGVH